MSTVEFILQGDKLTARLSGDIDHHNGAKLREVIDTKVSQMHPSELVLDFANVAFMDSSGIGLILGRYRWMRNLGGVVRITHISERMEHLLMLSGIHKLVRIESPEKHAKSAKMEEREIFSDSSKEVNYHAK